MHVAFHKIRLAALALTCLAFVVLGVWIMVTEPPHFDGFDRSVLGVIDVVIGSQAVLFFGGGLVVIMRMILQREPALELTDEGFVDRSSLVAAGFVPWSDVVGLRQYDTFGQRFLVVKVADPKKYVQRHGMVPRFFATMNVKMVGSPVSLTANSMRIDQATLYSVFKTHVERRSNDPAMA